MPELKNTFIKGRMNLDLDDRLVPEGEYREAMNIEVSTSEDSNVGTVQPVLGNNMDSQTNLTPDGGITVASVVNNQTDKIYYLNYCEEAANTPGGWDGIQRDIIVEHDGDGQVTPVVVDVWRVRTTIIQDQEPAPAANPPFNYITLPNFPGNTTVSNIRKGMVLECVINIPASVAGNLNPNTLTLTPTSGVLTDDSTGFILEDFGPVIVDRIVNLGMNRRIYLITKLGSEFMAPYLYLDSYPDFSQITFTADRVLNFRSHNLITGINIVDDFLFWTDNMSEPKRIHITKSKIGTPSFFAHSKFVVQNEFGQTPISTSWKPMKEHNITVLKKSPLTPPSLEMFSDISFARPGDTFGYTRAVNFTTSVMINPGDVNATGAVPLYENPPLPNGSIVEIPYWPTQFNFSEGFLPGDIVILNTNQDYVTDPQVFPTSEARVRAVVLEVTTTGPIKYIKVKILSFDKSDDFSPHSVNSAGEPNLRWAICLEQSKALFEFKFPRFAYRYKYQDGEYSSFSPFSKVAFIPGPFKYDSKESYNLGMVNQLRFLKILDFVEDGRDEGVIEVDILYKESNSPNIYTVKTVRADDDAWHMQGHEEIHIQGPPVFAKTKGAIQLESEVIYATVPANQLLRPWDNVPRKALAQEISANRVIYGNYVEGYDMTTTVDLKTYITTFEDQNEYIHAPEFKVGYPSIKSLRTYQVGIVYKDKLGRETPVFTNEKASFNVGKGLANNYNSLNVQNNSPYIPPWSHSYKFFIKETSNEYYNLAMDRWYDAEDGGVWISFPSADRNKLDEETYITLKKQHDTNVFVKEKARYKVIAIENEAPDFIRLERTSIAVAAVSSTPTDTSGSITISSGTTGTDVLQGKTFDVGKGGVVVRLFDENGTTEWFKVTSIQVASATANDSTILIAGTFGEPSPTITVPGTVQVEIAREVFHNKPEYQGRFFAKIFADDGVLMNNIETGARAGGTDFQVTASAKQYYMKSSSKDNSWCQKDQWWGDPSSWASVVGEAFYIDEINRNWGTSPGGPGPWSVDNGHGINATRGGALANHLELSLSQIKDSVDEGFSIAGHDPAQRQFYNSLTTEGTWIRWREDPNQIVYEIDRVRSQGDADYDSAHGSGIYNYDGGTGGSVRSWQSNKTKRMYIKLKATGWVNPGGTSGYQDFSIGNNGIGGAPPTWIDNTISTTMSTVTGWTTTTWDPTKNANNAVGGATVAAPYSIEQPVDDSDTTNFVVQDDNTNFGGTTSVTTGMDCAVQNPATGEFFNNIEIVRRFDTEELREMSENPGIFETEPKEDIGLDLYYEIDQAFPNEINESTNEQFAKLKSTVRTNFGGYTCTEDPAVNTTKELCETDGGWWKPDAFIETWEYWTPSNPGWICAATAIGQTQVNFSSGSPGKFVKIGDRPLGLIKQDYFIPGTTVAGIVDNDTIIFSNATLQAIPAGTIAAKGNPPLDDHRFAEVTPPKILQWKDNTMVLDTIPFSVDTAGGPLNFGPLGFRCDNISIPWDGWGDDDDAKHNLIIDKIDGGNVSTDIIKNTDGTFASTKWEDGINEVGVPGSTNKFLALTLQRNTSQSKIGLEWFNCYSFGNGVESDRIRDDYNAVRIDKGVKASTTLAKKYKQQRKCSSLIYSGIYNNTSGVNNLNQFIQAEKITKDLNPRHGCIQKLHAREGDLITLCEDKVFKILSNKDALYNADGNPQMIATSKVLGQATPMGGEYGISTNPESFAFQAYKAYFSDRSRGVILRLDSQGLVPISDHGMKDYFADRLPSTTHVIGSYDTKKDSYNVNLKWNSRPSETISFGEKTNGWTSFKSFVDLSGGVSLNNNYYTFHKGNIYKHHVRDNGTGVFYGTRQDPYIDVLFNQLPGTVKSFGTLKYEGSQSKISENRIDGEYYNNLAELGWYVSEGNTDLQQSDKLEFKNKEGKWFSRMKGQPYETENIDLTEFSFQGIDVLKNVYVPPPVCGCMNPRACNYNPLATIPCGDYGCTNSYASNYDSSATIDDESCTGFAFDLQIRYATTPSANDGAARVVYAGTNIEATDITPNIHNGYGPYAWSTGATTSEVTGLGIGPIGLTVTDETGVPQSVQNPVGTNFVIATTVNGCTDSTSANFNYLANTDNGSC
jgi:hypothetical protein